MDLETSLLRFFFGSASSLKLRKLREAFLSTNKFVLGCNQSDTSHLSSVINRNAGWHLNTTQRSSISLLLHASIKHRLGLRLRMNSSTELVITTLITLFSLQLVACFTVPSTYSTISGRRTWAKEGSQQSFTLRKKHPLLSYSQKDSTRNTHGEKNNLKRRKAPNSRIAIRWVVESIEKVLENENSNPEKKDGNNSKEDDNVLLSALDRMLKGT